MSPFAISMVVVMLALTVTSGEALAANEVLSAKYQYYEVREVLQESGD